MLSLADDSDAFAEELYLSILTRMPNDAERAAVAGYLQEAREADTVAEVPRDLGWALLTSAEFRFNH